MKQLKQSLDEPSDGVVCHRGTSPYVSLCLRWLICLLVLTGFCGCASGLLKMPGSAMFGKFPDLKKKKDKKEDEEDNDFGNKTDTPLLKEYVSIQGNNTVVLRAVGLVVGLDGTGDDPPPSALYTALRHEMSRRGVEPRDQKKLLQSKDTCLVVVTAYLPAMVRKGQKFDVTVAVPPNSDARSLKGGWLLETRLFEEQNVEGRGSMKGREYGVAYGAVLTAPGVEKDPTRISGELRRGTIPGGAISGTERDLSIFLMNNKRGFRNAKRVSEVISERFNHYDRFGQRVPLATAKTDAMLTLKVHPSYRNNFPRYQQVIRNIAFKEDEIPRRLRMEKLETEITEPENSQSAALQLEAIGTSGIPFLRRALESSDVEVRFHAAQALAYLGDASGVAVLKEATEKKPALRAYALAALSVVDDVEAVMAIRELMSADQLETRYGALRAMQELAPNDPSLRRIEFEKRFDLYLIDSAGQPMSHVTRRRTAEVVLFNAAQKLRLPAILNAGRFIRVIGESGDNHVVISKYSVGKDEPEQRTVSASLAEIIAACGDLGANYPDIVQMMIEAEQQHNLEGQFGIDRMPQAGRVLVRNDFIAESTTRRDGEGDSASEKPDSSADSPSADGTADDESSDDESGSPKASHRPKEKRIGTPAMIPNLFDRLDEEEIRRQESDEKLNALRFEDVTDGDETDAESALDDRKSTSKPTSEQKKTDAESGTKSAAGDTSDSESPPEASAESSVDQETLSESGEAGSEASNSQADDESSNEESADSENASRDESSADTSEESADTGDDSKDSGRSFGDRIRSFFGRSSEPAEPEPEPEPDEE